MATRNPSPEEVFHRARRIEASGERDGYLQGACGDDLALRSKVDALLKADAEAGSFLASGGQPGGASGATGATSATPPSEQVGAMIGRYKLLQEIGEGGFGVVYLAEQRKPMRRKVALKVIKLGMDTKQVIARFEAERQALAMMDHANIAKVLDAGATDSGRPYFVMELVKGIPITDYCDQASLTVQERLDLFGLVCSAVQHAHQKGIIHRDIKPSNVLVTLHDGVPVPKVIDFGIAKATSAELTEKTLFTEHGQMVGTPLYMSPEQAEMSGLDIDTRSDIYSLGVLLYELLTGTTPFTIEELRGAGLAEMQRLIREQEPQKPSTRLSTLDTLPSIAAHRKIEPRKLPLLMRGDLDWIIMKALEKDRTRRYETANAFAADLGRFLTDEPVLASPPSAAYRVRKFVRRNRRGVIAGGVMAVVLLAAAGVAIHFGVSEGRQRRVAERNADLAKQSAAELAETNTHLTKANKEVVRANDLLEAETERAERQTYSALLQSAQAQLDAGNFADAQRLHNLCPEPYRNWEWRHLGLSLDQSLQTLAGHESTVNSVAWSPDGTRIVSGSWDKTLRIWDAASGESIQILEGHGGGVRSVAWSPDGTRIVSGSSDKTLRVWDAATGESLLTLEGHAHRVTSVAWSPDGTRIVSGSWDSALRIWDAQSGERLLTLVAPWKVQLVAWSPDGTRIFSVSGNKTLHLWDAESGESLLTLEGHESSVYSVAWSPDGTRIVTGSRDKTLRIWDAGTGEGLSTLRGHSGGVTSVAWSPGGTRIVSGSGDATLRFWDVAGEGNVSTVEWHGEELASVAWSPDGTRILLGAFGGTLRILDAASGESLLSLMAHGDDVQSAAWSPDGTRIVSGSMDMTLRIWDAATGESLLTLEGHEGHVWCVAWSPDGTRIASAAWDSTLRIWDAASGKSLLTLEAQAVVDSVAWSPDGTRIVSGSSDKTLRVWDAATGESLLTLEGHANRVTSVAWSPDGTRIVSGSWDNTLRIWNAATGESLLTLEGHESSVTSVSWSPDGTRIVSGSDDKTLHIWDAETGDSLLILEGQGASVRSVSWSPDGTRIASGTSSTNRTWIASETWDDKTLLIWESRLEDALPLWRAEDSRRRVRPLVRSLFKEHLFLELVLSALRDADSLPDDLREVALKMARSRGNPTFGALYKGARSLVGSGHWDKETDVAFALRLARAAVELAPEVMVSLPNGTWEPATAPSPRTILAWALFANGLHDEALAESEHALELAGEEYKVKYQGYLDRLRENVTELRSTNTPGEQASAEDR